MTYVTPNFFLKRFGIWLDYILPDEPKETGLHALELEEEEFNPKKDLEELKRLLADDLCKEQQQGELQEPCRGVIITTTWTPVFTFCVSKHRVMIPTLEKVLKCDPFLLSVQPIPTLVKIPGLNRFKLGLPIFETKSQILQIGPKRKLNATYGLVSILLEVY